MDLDTFWALIERGRADCGDRWPAGADVGKAVAHRLAVLPADSIMAFDRTFRRTFARADQWEVCAAAYVIHDYLSDDSFTDFKAGLVALGRDDFELAVTTPDALADLPLVQAIAAGRADRFVLSAEQLFFAACAAYGEGVGDDYWERTKEDDFDLNPWNGGFGSPEDGAAIPRRLPRLNALFQRVTR